MPASTSSPNIDSNSRCLCYLLPRVSNLTPDPARPAPSACSRSSIKLTFSGSDAVHGPLQSNDIEWHLLLAGGSRSCFSIHTMGCLIGHISKFCYMIINQLPLDKDKDYLKLLLLCVILCPHTCPRLSAVIAGGATSQEGQGGQGKGFDGHAACSKALSTSSPP